MLQGRTYLLRSFTRNRGAVLWGAVGVFVLVCVSSLVQY